MCAPGGAAAFNLLFEPRHATGIDCFLVVGRLAAVDADDDDRVALVDVFATVDRERGATHGDAFDNPEPLTSHDETELRKIP